METTDVAIIGAGPIGLELAAGFKRSGIDYVQIEKRQIGQTIFWFPHETRFFSSTERITIAGVPLHTSAQEKCTREEYLAYLRQVALQFDLPVRTYERVLAVEPCDDGAFLVKTDRRGQRQKLRARRVVFSTGGTARPRMLEIDGEDLPHVSHYFHDPHQYFRQKVLIVGGKNSAVEAALRCYHAGAEVALSYRRAELDPKAIKYWMLPEINSLVSAGRIDAHWETAPAGITPTHVRLARTDGSEYDIEADFVLLMVGYVADMSLLASAGVELSPDGQTPACNLDTMETNVPGLYVAGTAVAGTQTDYGVFLENCHIHVDRIIAHIEGDAPPQQQRKPAGPLET